MRAWSLIRSEPWYRREAFIAGLQAAGYTADSGAPTYPIKPGEVLLTWNRYGDREQIANQFEAAGGIVLVAENGYLGAGGTSPKFDVDAGPQPGHYYALARGGHNGRGTWHTGGPERFAALGVELKPWRGSGEYILICPNREFGQAGMAMPLDWERDAANRLAGLTRMPIRIRKHPGNHAPKWPLERDLEGAHLCVIWSSSCGVHALAAGVPVACEAPYWICKSAAIAPYHDVPAQPPDRQAAFERLAWAQWTLTEIESGEPFRHLLSDTRQSQSALAV